MLQKMAILVEETLKVLVEAATLVIGSLLVDKIFIDVDTLLLETSETGVQRVQVGGRRYRPSSGKVEPEVSVGLIDQR